MNPEAASAADAIISFHVIDARPCEKRRAVEATTRWPRTLYETAGVVNGDPFLGSYAVNGERTDGKRRTSGAVASPRLEQGANSISARHLERQRA